MESVPDIGVVPSSRRINSCFCHAIQFHHLAGCFLERFTQASLDPAFGLLAHLVNSLHQKVHQVVGEILTSAMQES
jgi:hypothetical protein